MCVHRAPPEVRGQSSLQDTTEHVPHVYLCRILSVLVSFSVVVTDLFFVDMFNVEFFSGRKMQHVILSAGFWIWFLGAGFHA